MAEVMVDIDDVIFPTIASIHQRAFEAGLHDGTAPMIWAGWEVYTLPDGSVCTPEVYWDLWSDFALDGGYVTTEPVPGAAEALRRLHFAGHRIHLVTARAAGLHDNDAPIREWTRRWLADFAIPHDSLTFARDKALIHRILQDGGGGFDYAIDDRPKNVAALQDAGVRAYLLTHQHNSDVAGLPRVETVDKFVDTIIRENP